MFQPLALNSFAFATGPGIQPHDLVALSLPAALDAQHDDVGGLKKVYFQQNDDQFEVGHCDLADYWSRA